MSRIPKKSPAQDKLETLRNMVAAATAEMDTAIVLHETWKPTVSDKDLHRRMDNSYAGHAFIAIRHGLRQAMLSALMRIWDRNSDAINLEQMVGSLNDNRVFDLICERLDKQARKVGFLHASDDAQPVEFGDEEYRERVATEIASEMRISLRNERAGLTALFTEYHRGIRKETLQTLLEFRNERLAHHGTSRKHLTNCSSDAVEAFYQRTIKIVPLFRSIIDGIAYDPSDTAKIYGDYAKFFWAGARSEQVVGHPSNRES